MKILDVEVVHDTLAGGTHRDYLAMVVQLSPSSKPCRAFLMDKDLYWELETEQHTRFLSEKFSQHPLALPLPEIP